MPSISKVLLGFAAVVACGLLVRRGVQRHRDARLTDMAIDVMHAAHPDWSLGRAGSLAVDIKVGGASAVMHLDNIARAADADDARFRELVALSAKNVADALGDAHPGSFDAVRDRVRAVLVPSAFASEQGVVQRPFTADVAEAFVLDSPTRMTYVMPHQAADWHVGPVELHDAGTRALWHTVQREPLEPFLVASPTGKLVVIRSSDNYAAARLLVSEQRSALAKLLGSPFLAAVPNRDELLAASADYPKPELAARAQAGFTEGPYPVSPRILRVEGAVTSAEP